MSGLQAYLHVKDRGHWVDHSFQRIVEHLQQTQATLRPQ